MSQAASVLNVNLIGVVQKSYYHTKKLNAANSNTESKEKLTSQSSPYGWMKFRNSADYYYIKEQASEVANLLRETIGMLEDSLD